MPLSLSEMPNIQTLSSSETSRSYTGGKSEEECQIKIKQYFPTRYAGLYFCICVDISDNNLFYLEAIHNFVEVIFIMTGVLLFVLHTLHDQCIILIFSTGVE